MSYNYFIADQSTL